MLKYSGIGYSYTIINYYNFCRTLRSLRIIYITEMKISVIQPDIIWEDKPANFRNLERLIIPLFNKTDIVILPEMFNTGFSMFPEKLGESDSGETYEWMKRIASEGNFGICGSFIVREDHTFLNRWFFVTPGDDMWHYDKRHLFSMGGEDRLFTQGKSRLIFTFRGVRISPYICYDLRFRCGAET